MRSINIIAILLGLFLCMTPALAEDPPGDEATTEATAPADEAVPSDEAAAPADEATAPEGDEAAPADGDEATAPADGDETPAVEGENTEDPAEEIADIEEAAEAAFALIDAIKSKNWPLAVGLILMLVVFVANKLGLKNLVGPKAVPWIAMGLAVFGTVGTGLITGLGWADAIVQGVLAGVVAIGGWELLLKHFLGDKGDAVTPEAPSEASTDPGA